MKEMYESYSRDWEAYFQYFYFAVFPLSFYLFFFQMEDDEIKPHLPLVPSNLAPNTIKLSDLLDFAVQQVFHELTVLSEL